MEVGATSRAPDPPEVAAKGAVEASGSRSHRSQSCRGLPPAVGSATGRLPTLPRRDDP
jgi:hypothetical protein